MKKNARMDTVQFKVMLNAFASVTAAGQVNTGDARLRQVSGINYLIQMCTYRLACGDSEITWVG